MARLCTQMCHLLDERSLKSLNDNKIFTVIDLLQEYPEKLVRLLKKPYKEVLQIRHTIIANYSSFPRRGIDMYEDLVNSFRSHPDCVDLLLQGGLFTGNLYEVYGPSGDGKTQLCLTIACNVAHYLKQHVHYIDTKFDFSGKRTQAMLEARACSDWETGAVMERIRVTRVKDVYETHQFLHQLKGILQDGQDAESSVRLVIIDALPSLFLPFLGESHNDGLGLMNHLVNTIKYLSLEYHVVFLVVNIALWSSNEDALENPREMLAGIRPALGHFWLHVPNTRLLIQKKTPQGDARTVTVTKSTSVALGQSCTVTISGKGVV